MTGPRETGPALPDLTPAEVTDLCSAAQRAWRSLPGRAKQARFTWRGRPFLARHTGFRLVVDTPDGRPVACRWD